MHFKRLLIITVILCVATDLVEGTIIPIYAPPNSFGTVTILPPQNNGYWYTDTVFFNTGLSGIIKVTFLILDARLLMLGLGSYQGGMIFIDSLSQVCYRLNPGLKKTYFGDKFYDGSSHTYNNPDTNWSTAVRYPDTCAPADTFLYQQYSKLKMVNARCIYYKSVLSPPYFQPCTSTRSVENYQAIFYVKIKNVHFKMQICSVAIEEKIIDTTKNTFLKSFTLRWAVIGGGSSVMPQTPAKKVSQINYSLSKTEKTLTMILPEDFVRVNDYTADIFDLSGKLLYHHVSPLLNQIKYSSFKSGRYVLVVTGKNTILIKNILLF
jgi:hypothetical protein